MDRLQQIKDEAERIHPYVKDTAWWWYRELFIAGGTYALLLDNWVRCEDEEPPICPEFLAFMSDGTMSIEKHEWSTSLNRYFYNPHITHWKIKPLPPQTTLST